MGTPGASDGRSILAIDPLRIIPIYNVVMSI